MKKCIKCLKIKEASQFNTGRNQCKCCRLKYKQSLPKKNHPISVTEKSCTECNVIKSAEDFHPDGAFLTGLYPYCRPCSLIKQQEKYQRHADKYNAKAAENYKKVRCTEEYRTKANARQKRKLQTDPKFLLIRRLRNRLWYALKKKSWKKNTKFYEYIGCDLEFLKSHIESQFIPGMSWDNQGEWHIDHIIPLDSAQTEEELHKLCHYTNLQPMWAVENIKKGTKI